MDLNLNKLTYSINNIHCVSRITGRINYYKEIINILSLIVLLWLFLVRRKCVCLLGLLVNTKVSFI